MRLSHFIPSMFQRRLLLLMAGMLVLAVLPLLQMARLTVVKGAGHLEDAEQRLISESWTETVRGRILDRKGRELARDRPSFDVLVDYSVITGRWAELRAARAARRAVERSGKSWQAMGPEDRLAASAKFRGEFDEHLKKMWTEFSRLSGLAPEEIERKKAEIIEQVQYLSTLVTERQRVADAERRQREGKPAKEGAPGARVVVQEQREPHVLLRDVPDSIGFAFERVKDRTTADEDELLDAGVGAGGTSVVGTLPVMPGLHVRNSMRRDYPFDVSDVVVDTSTFPPPLREGTKTVRVQGVATHVLGRMREKLFREDLVRRPRVRSAGQGATGEIDRGHYRPGDTVGQGGVEQAKEDVLRGLRGQRTKHLDTGKEDLIDATAGRDVTLNVDIALQARVQALFDPSLGLTVIQPWQRTKKPDEPLKPDAPQELPMGTALNGAVVVMDVLTGDVLAMVSHPSFTHEQIGRAPETIPNDPYHMAFLNRPLGKAYQPGSVVKPLVLCAAMAAGKYAESEQIPCTGHFFKDKPLLYRCWIYKQFKTTHSVRLGHDVDGADGIKCSCNIFFYEMGQRLGTQRVFDLYTELGVGPKARTFNIFDLPELPERAELRDLELKRRSALVESAGDVKDPVKATIQEAILMGIGQGPVTWTPLHAATAYAAIARGGEMIEPRLYADAPTRTRDLGFSASAVQIALRGLYGSANEENGTTHVITYTMDDGSKKVEPIFNAKGITIWAKSGTADTGPFKADLSQQDGREESYDGDHSWCAVIAGVGQTPRYAIACVVDYGGSGGRVSGPLANQVVHALIAEGYLPDLREESGDGRQARGSVTEQRRAGVVVGGGG